MLVYRLETEDGKGPYYNGNLVGKIENELGIEFTDLRFRHPIPDDDSELCRNLGELRQKSWFEGYHFGFESYSQFRNWFYSDPIIEKLAEKGFFLTLYSSPDIRRGNTQCVFQKGERVATFPPNVSKAKIEETLKSKGIEE